MTISDLHTDEIDFSFLNLCNAIQKLERDKSRFRALRYYQNNYDKVNKQNKKWYRKKGKEYHREYYHKNRK